MSRLPTLAVLALAASLGSCGQGIDAPPAPNLQPVLQAYANPTAVVGSEIMAAVADEIEAAAEEIQNSEIFKEILDLIAQVQEELDAVTVTTCSGGANKGSACTSNTDCPDGACVGNVVFDATCSGGTNDGNGCNTNSDCPDGTCSGGVTFPTPTGAIRVNYICPGIDPGQFEDGYDAEPDAADGSIDLWMTLDSGGIGRVVWGTATKCLYLVPNEGGDCEASGCSEASYDGGIALDLGEDVPPGQDIDQLPVTFLIEGTIGFDGGEFRINQSFRVILAVESGLEILVDLADPALSETFNYFFLETQQGIRDATGVFGCSLEDSQCFDLICNAGANAGNACTTDADCPEGTCVQRELFSW
jgi:hypothetical protein